MVSRLNFCRATLTVISGFCFSKSIINFAPSVFKSNSKSDELASSEKDTPSSSYMSISTPNYANASVSTPAESIPPLKYSKAYLIRIFKIFLKIKSQKPKAKVVHKRFLKAKIPDVYFKKLHIDCYNFC